MTADEVEAAPDGTVRARFGRVTFTVRTRPGEPAAGAADRVLRALARGVVAGWSERPGDGDLDRSTRRAHQGDGPSERLP